MHFAAALLFGARAVDVAADGVDQRRPGLIGGLAIHEGLVAENRRRSRAEFEYELMDTGVFDEDRYWDVKVEFAKDDPEDVLIRITATNHGPEAAVLHLLPHLWFRNTWSWGGHDAGERPSVRRETDGSSSILAEHATLGRYRLACEGRPDLLTRMNP